jgi:hypothetical protein
MYDNRVSLPSSRMAAQPVKPCCSKHKTLHLELGLRERGHRTLRNNFESWTKPHSATSQQTVFPPTLTDYILVSELHQT